MIQIAMAVPIETPCRNTAAGWSTTAHKTKLVTRLFASPSRARLLRHELRLEWSKSSEFSNEPKRIRVISSILGVHDQLLLQEGSKRQAFRTTLFVGWTVLKKEPVDA